MIERMKAYRDHYLRCYNAALERGDQSNAEVNQRLFYDMVDRLVELGYYGEMNDD
jgi:hypothetical protein